MNQILTKISFVYNNIVEDINKGKYQVGSYLYSEKKLCDIYNVSRQTIRSVLDRLKYEGFILKRKGKKSLIISRHASFKPEIYSIKHQLIRSGNVPIYKILDYKFFKNKDKKNKFNLGDALHFIRRVRLVEKKIILISNAFISEKLVPEFNVDKFTIKDKETTLVNTLIRRYKIDFMYNKQDIVPILLKQYYSNIFNLPLNTPAFSHKWFFYNSNKQLVLFDEELYVDSIKISNVLHY